MRGTVIFDESAFCTAEIRSDDKLRVTQWLVVYE